MTTAKPGSPRQEKTVYKIFEGQAGYYVRDENEDGLHHPPSDYGRRIGWDRPEAERVLAEMEAEAEDY